MSSHGRRLFHVLGSLGLCCIAGYAQAQDVEESAVEPNDVSVDSVSDNSAARGVRQGGSLDTVHVVATAEEELKQAPGVSVITSEDIQRRPPANDLSEILRTMPGVNLTGNSASGQRGNNRQIDIRGMGPENTLILIDGKPVTSRNSVRYGWRGERDTRGDSNWVAPELVERIEVIRGPAAARYGNGAAGGVVNIITKRDLDKLGGQVTLYANQPTHSDDGKTRRATFSLSGPLGERFSFRLSGNANKTGADAPDINEKHAISSKSVPAGREGVRNRDIRSRLTWKLLDNHYVDFDANFSRQGNIYAGDTQNNNTNTYVENNLGGETNRMYRQNFAVTYNGKFDQNTVMAYYQYSKTRNTRINEGLAGGAEGIFTSYDYSTSSLRDYTAHAEINMPTTLSEHVAQNMTLGVEWNLSKLNDPNSMKQTASMGAVPGISSSNRSTATSANILSFFAEDNIVLFERLTLTPGVRFDHHSKAGSNWSPALNLSFAATDTVNIKAGIARAFKAPNLYQMDENYLLASRGNGCQGKNSCYLQGNSNLKPEYSVNKELGVEYLNEKNQMFGITYFHNAYRNKIEAGDEAVGVTSFRQGRAVRYTDIYQWRNIPKATVHGLEGTLKLPFLDNKLDWTTNFTYMFSSKNKKTGDALTIIPKYTINSTLLWKINADWSAQANYTHYGRQHARRFSAKGAYVVDSAKPARGSYSLIGLSTSYDIKKTKSKFTLGVSNLFDKRLYRRGNAAGLSTTSGAGAETYNEPGRAFYMSFTQAF